ncbi:RILP-like protein 1 isoform X3 [Hippocampus zosterae]|uniref:RILP-like protein 1 isoform X2 n=1 Tax=Hippocampus zosterae TaxID=109293 RepID=UPI00223D7A82|nr:RILP-like protein 1 isoform X2 [Hippocampus zosterae]XP_051907882.1 RILP-like protein 1 isoform X3 [Hippocampus zosterae]
MEGHRYIPEDRGGSAMEKNPADLTVMDVYDIAAAVGHEFERIIDQYGCEALSRLMPKVVRVLEILEVMVSRHSIGGPEADELRLELDKLRLERTERLEKERKHRKELELVEDVWRGEAQDLLCQIAQLQEENKSLLDNVSLRDSASDEDLQRTDGMSERERQVMKKLKEVVDKQRDEIRAKDRQLTLRSEDIEALQQQQSRLMKINHDLRHKISAVEAQGKALIEQKVELEAGAQSRGQEVGALRQEVARLRERLKGDVREALPQPPSPAEAKVHNCHSLGNLLNQREASAVVGAEGWLESSTPPPPPGSLWPDEDEEDEAALLWEAMCDDDMPAVYQYFTKEALCQEDTTTELPDFKDPNRARFTLQELRDVLHERNELKAKVFLLQEELAYYKSDETEEDTAASSPEPESRTRSRFAVQPESGIKRLIFTAFMPMVAAGLIRGDPTLQPARGFAALV